MLGTRLASLSSLAGKSNIVSVILVGNALVWYFTVLRILQIPSIGNNWVWLVHFSTLILAAFAGASLAKHMERSRFLILWMIMGITASTLLFTLENASGILVYLVSSFLGLSLGLGMPACMSYFTDAVPIEKRGRVSGITLLACGIGIIAFGFPEFIEPSNLPLVGAVLGIWRFSSLAVFLSAKNYRRTERKENEPSYKKVFSQRSFMLYFIPWILFSFVNYLAVLPPPSYLEGSLVTVQSAFMGGAAVLGGFLIDVVGRKRISIAGFAMLGVGAAILGMVGPDLVTIFASGATIPPWVLSVLYFNSAIDGIALGFLFVLFVLTIWGDLGHSSSSDKFYALGVTPFFASKLLELTVGPLILNNVSGTMAFFLTAFFLFLAVLPLVYAPETLPEKTMRERELKIYVEKAQEIAQEYY